MDRFNLNFDQNNLDNLDNFNLDFDQNFYNNPIEKKTNQIIDNILLDSYPWLSDSNITSSCSEWKKILISNNIKTPCKNLQIARKKAQNRISAKKSANKKKEYIKTLEIQINKQSKYIKYLEEYIKKK